MVEPHARTIAIIRIFKKFIRFGKLETATNIESDAVQLAVSTVGGRPVTSKGSAAPRHSSSERIS